MDTITLDRNGRLLTDPDSPWDDLAGGVPFRQLAWLRPWWDHFGRHLDTVFITVRDRDNQVRGVLPLVRRGPRKFEMIAGGLLCSDHLSLLARDEDTDRVATSIAEYLLSDAASKPSEAEPLPWDRIRFDGIAAGDPRMRTLLTGMTQRGARLRLKTRMNLWYLRCLENWEEHLKRLNHRTRNRTRSMLRKITENEVPFSVEIVDQEQDIEPTLNELIRLHQNHWNALGQPGSYADPAMVHQVHDAAKLAFHRGRLLLPKLMLTDRQSGQTEIIAAQLHFVGDDRRLYCYSTAVDYRHAKLSPGTMLNNFLYFLAHQEKRPGIDFLRGDEPYKHRLVARPTPLLQADVFSLSRGARLEIGADDGFFRVKQMVRSHVGRNLVRELTLDEAFGTTARGLKPQSLTKIRHAPLRHSLGTLTVSLK